MTFLVALAIAVAIVALVGATIAWVNAVAEKRLLRRLAVCKCADCGTPFGIEVVSRGRDTSPFEELWQIGDEQDVHCYPTYLTVVCGSCDRTMEIRYQTQGADFGPEFLVARAEDGGVFGAVSGFSA